MGYGCFITNRHTHFFNSVGKCFVEFTTGNLPCPVPSGRKLIGEKIIANFSILYKFGPEFFLETLLLNRINKAPPR